MGNLNVLLTTSSPYKNSYTHELFDLNQSPWNITVFLLKNNLLTIFVRFDALIFRWPIYSFTYVRAI